MKRAAFLFLISYSAIGAAYAEPVADDMRVTYQKGPIGDTYRDKVQKDGSWKIRAVVRASKPQSSAAKMALYRGAEIATSKGFKFVQLISVKEKPLENYIAGSFYIMGYEAKMTLKPTNDADATNHCSADIKSSCATYDAAAALTEIEPYLKFKEAKK